MVRKEPATEMQPQFSSAGAVARSWAEARAILEEAQVYWLTTVRPDGRPHVTPVFAIWSDDAWYFCTGEGERKAKNLVHNPDCVITTGCNVSDGLDVVIEGVAIHVRDDARLRRLAELWRSRYDWEYTVDDGARSAATWATSRTSTKWLRSPRSGSARARHSARPGGASSAGLGG